ncbi:unnamed protein product [Lupinus luteus]|uniref:Uncharacterized protein n=1 Tax=Lupinus luteus TaxID=3873 RepID=A0AAV1W8A6_LUPLU
MGQEKREDSLGRQSPLAKGPMETTQGVLGIENTMRFVPIVHLRPWSHTLKAPR